MEREREVFNRAPTVTNNIVCHQPEVLVEVEGLTGLKCIPFFPLKFQFEPHSQRKPNAITL